MTYEGAKRKKRPLMAKSGRWSGSAAQRLMHLDIGTGKAGHIVKCIPLQARSSPAFFTLNIPRDLLFEDGEWQGTCADDHVVEIADIEGRAEGLPGLGTQL